MRVKQAKRLKELEKENVRLKRLVADLTLDNVPPACCDYRYKYSARRA